MKKLNELSKDGFYLRDHIDGAMPNDWTADLVGDGFYNAQYQGGKRNAKTGEWTGGKWVETGGPSAEDKAAAARAAFVAERNERMAKLTVTVDGYLFDADEVSQSRMLRAQTVMSDVDTTPWVLNDNTVIQADKQLLLRALDAASKAQAALWVMPEDAS